MADKTFIRIINRLSPGDGLIMTAALRDLHVAHPGVYETAVECPFQEVFDNNPYVSRRIVAGSRGIEMQYPLIHVSGRTGRHFTEGYRDFLAKELGIDIPVYSMKPEIYLSPDELNWPNPVALEHGYDGPYWIVNAGIKGDYPLKFYPYHQEVVHQLNEAGIRVVQVGHLSHKHPPLDGVLDMRGKTSLRQLFRLSYHAEGAICAVSLQMVVMAAFEKPCVVINGGREGIRWQHYANQRFLAVNGALPCCRLDGCWKSKLSECVAQVHRGPVYESGKAVRPAPDPVPLCMELITPEEIVRNVLLYYKGGVLKKEEVTV